MRGGAGRGEDHRLAALLKAKAPELLAGPLDIQSVDLVADKLAQSWPKILAGAIGV